MTPNEMDTVLHAVEHAHADLKRDLRDLKQDLDTFRAYADQTYVRKDILAAQEDATENIHKKRDRLKNAALVLFGGVGLLITVLLNLFHK